MKCCCPNVSAVSLLHELMAAQTGDYYLKLVQNRKVNHSTILMMI